MSLWSAGMVATLVTSTPSGPQVLGERGRDDPPHLVRVEPGRAAAPRRVIALVHRSRLPALRQPRRPAPSAASRWPRHSSRRVREVLPPVAAPGLLRRAYAAATSARGDGEQVGRLPGRRCAAGAAAGAELGQRPRRSRPASRPLRSTPGARGSSPAAASARDGRPAPPSPAARRRPAPGRPARGRLARDVRRRSAGRRPAPPAASWRPAGWRRARRCRRPRRRRTGRGSRSGRAGRCGRRRGVVRGRRDRDQVGGRVDAGRPAGRR